MRKPPLKLVYLLAAIVLPLLWYPEVLFLGRSFYFLDLSSFHVALRMLAADELKAGRWPLWNPYSWNGFPLLGQAEIGALSPLNLPFLLPIAPYVALNILMLAHFSIACGAAYALARVVGVQRGGALLSALAYAGGGYLMARVTDIGLLMGSAWAPLVCAFLLRAMERRKARDALWAGLTLALQLLTSHPQIPYYTLLLIGLFALYGVWREWQGESEHKSEHQPRPSAVLRCMGYPVLTLIIGLGIAAPQLTTGFELLTVSRRSAGVALESQVYLSTPPTSVLTLIFPRLFMATNDWRNNNLYDSFHFYLGLVPLICVALTVRKMREPIVAFSWLLVVVSVALALGKFTPLYGWAMQIPGLSFFRVPSRWLFITALVCIILVGKGAEVFAELAAAHKAPVENSRYRSVLTRMGRILTILLTALALTVPLALFIRPLDAETLKYDDDFSRERLASRADVAARLPREAGYLVMVGGGALALFWLYERRRISPRHFAVWILALTYADLFLTGGQPTTAPEYWAQGDALANFVRERGAYERVFSTGGYVDFMPRLGDANPTMYRIFGSSGEALPIGIQRLVDYLNGAPALRLLQLSSTRWVVLPAHTPRQWNDFAPIALNALPSLSLAWANEQIRVYTVPQPLPRAYVVYQALHAATPTDALALLRDASFEAQRAAIFEADITTNTALFKLLPQTDLPLTPARIVSYAPDTIQLEAHAVRDGLLVLTDTFYPGWRATVDGVEQPIIRANFLFRGIMVRAGQHHVELRYHPWSFQIGLSIAALTLLFTAFVFYRTR
jgi:hypothetical protein